MKIINLFGGPGAGKTTIAYYLAYRMKKAGYRAELVGEAAREIIYDRNPGVTAAQLLDNQLLISGLQYERLKRLERHDMDVIIADSPLRMGLVYAKDLPEYEGLKAAIEALEADLPRATNVFVQRTEGVYDKESRAQDEKQAMELDAKIWNLTKYHHLIHWGNEPTLADELIADIERDYNGN